jgi:hypothetical protein
MEILNIITCSLNTVDSVKSFVITDQEKRQAVVDQAEKEFEKIIREMGYDEDDDISMDAVLDNGYYQSKVNGQQSVCLSWSNKIEFEKVETLLVPSSDDEDEYSDELTFQEACTLSEKRNDSGQVFKFNTVAELTAFYEGVGSMVDWNGRGKSFDTL